MCQGMYEITEHEKQYINQDDAIVTISFQVPRRDWNLLENSDVWCQFEKLLLETRNIHTQKCRREMGGSMGSERERGRINLNLKTEKVTDLIAIIDEKLDNCIKKLRNVVYGDDARAAIIEYEELMLEKADLVTWGLFMKEKEAMQKCVKRMQWCSRTRGRGK